MLVEYVAVTRAALQPVLSDPDVVAAFVKGQQNPTAIKNALKTYKSDFDFAHFGVVRLP